MLRHMLQSIRRISHLAPLHHRKSFELTITSPLKYSKALLRMHLPLLGTAQRLDEQVISIQQTGVPFLFQDFPEIGLESVYCQQAQS